MATMKARPPEPPPEEEVERQAIVEEDEYRPDLGDDPEPEDAGAEFVSPAMILRNQPSGPRIETPWPTLQRVTRGGPRVGNLVILTGAAGSGKTAAAMHLGGALAVNGRVGLVALLEDEGPTAPALAIGQLLGLDRDRLQDIEHPDVRAAEQEAFDRRLRGRSILFVNPSPRGDLAETRTTVERACEQFARFPEGLPRVLIVDSLQTVACRADIDGERPSDQHVQVRRLVVVLRELARQWQCLVLAISQVTRDAYRRKKVSEQSDPLAAGYGGAGIEHSADLQIHLSGSATEGPVSAQITKSRLGKKARFRLLLDMTTGRFTEVDEDVAEAEARAEKLQRKIETANKTVQSNITTGMNGIRHAEPPGLTFGRLRDFWMCEGSNDEKKIAIDAIAARTDVEVEVLGIGRPTYYRLRTPSKTP